MTNKETIMHGYVTATLATDKKLVHIGSFEGDHDCCYQIAGLNKTAIGELIEELIELHSQIEDKQEPTDPDEQEEYIGTVRPF